MNRPTGKPGRSGARSALLLATVLAAAATSLQGARPAGASRLPAQPARPAQPAQPAQPATAVSGPIIDRHTIGRGVSTWTESWTGAAGAEHAYLLSADLHVASAQARSPGGYTGMLRRTSAIAHGAGAVAAVNGDFFSPVTQQAYGGHVDNGYVVKSPAHHWNAQLATHPDGTVTIGPVEFSGTATLVGTHSRQSLASINTLSDALAGRLTLLSPRMQREIATTESCRYVSGRVDTRGVLTVVGQYVRYSSPVVSGRTEVLVSCSGSVRSWLTHLRRGARVQLSTHLDQRVRSLLSGGRVVIARGRPYDDRGAMSVGGRNPETAVCVSLDRRHLLLAVIDGSYTGGYSAGVTVPEAQAFLLAHHCYDALLLDGGGSSTMYAAGAVLNHPTDYRGERNVPDALLVFAGR